MSYNTCGGRTTDSLHGKQVIFLLLQFGEILSMRVEEIISCVDEKFFGTLLNEIILQGFPQVGVLTSHLDKISMYYVFAPSSVVERCL